MYEMMLQALAFFFLFTADIVMLSLTLCCTLVLGLYAYTLSKRPMKQETRKQLYEHSTAYSLVLLCIAVFIFWMFYVHVDNPDMTFHLSGTFIVRLAGLTPLALCATVVTSSYYRLLTQLDDDTKETDGSLATLLRDGL